MKKTIDYYMGLKYKINVIEIDESEGGGYLLEMPELGRLSTCAWGETFEEARTMLSEIQRDNIEDLLAKGLDVPEPSNEAEYSGRLNLRMPKTLHKRLAEIARDEKTSINSLIVNMLHECLGGRSTERMIDRGLKQVDLFMKQLQEVNVTHSHRIMPQQEAVAANLKTVESDLRKAEKDFTDFAKAS